MGEHAFGMSIMKCNRFIDSNTLDEALAFQIKQLLLDAIYYRNHAYLVVSGGKTPVGLFKLLAQAPLPWEKVTITLADERCVAAEDKDKNERLVKEYLLQAQAKNAQWISLYDDEIPFQSIESQINALPVFDVVILGVGEDGHTASLFPCSKELALALEDDAPAMLLVNPTTALHQRVSLSKRRLLQSRAIFFHITGEKKWKVLEIALAENDPMRFPVCAFLNAPQVQVMYAPL
jgi:6-phosphogluconolactonase